MSDAPSAARISALSPVPPISMASVRVCWCVDGTETVTDETDETGDAAAMTPPESEGIIIRRTTGEIKR
nr:hypothetical protein [Kofleriaceae bacterium]